MKAAQSRERLDIQPTEGQEPPIFKNPGAKPQIRRRLSYVVPSLGSEIFPKAVGFNSCISSEKDEKPDEI